MALAVGVLLAEVIALGALGVLEGDLLPQRGLQEKRNRLLESAARVENPRHPTPLEVLHPFLGFVYNPETESGPLSRTVHGVPVSRFGFLDRGPPIHRRSEDRFIVGIFGGSFASWVFLDAREVLAEGLRTSSLVGDREIVFVHAALGGYKQPQQLMTLAWLLSLGGEFDLVLNIDGFNEVVLPALENIPKGVFPYFPRNWLLRTNDIPYPAVLRVIGRAELLRGLRVAAASIVSRPWLRWSATVNLLWRAVDRGLESGIAGSERALLDTNLSSPRYVTSGPFEPFSDRDSALHALAVMWRDASIQMGRLAAANDARYLHFLQPNQYLEGTKPLTPSERRIAVHEHGPFTELVREGYPYLRAEAEVLESSGVSFYDLTDLFVSVTEELYIDDCCHVNARGNELVAEAVARAAVLELGHAALPGDGAGSSP